MVTVWYCRAIRLRIRTTRPNDSDLLLFTAGKLGDGRPGTMFHNERGPEITDV